jgi:hypothetical protein
MSSEPRPASYELLGRGTGSTRLAVSSTELLENIRINKINRLLMAYPLAARQQPRLFQHPNVVAHTGECLLAEALGFAVGFRLRPAIRCRSPSTGKRP